MVRSAECRQNALVDFTEEILLCNKCIDMASNCCLTMQIHLLSNLKHWAEKLELALWGWGSASYFGVKTRVPTCLTRSHILYRFLWNCYARRHGETQSTWTRTAMPSGVIW